MRISQSKTAIFLGALLTIVGCGSSGGKGGASTGSLIPAEYSTKLNGLEITSDNKAQVKENQKNAIDVDANTTRGKALTYSIYGTDVDKFDINESTGLVTFKEAPDYENDANKTAYFFTVKVDDTNAELSQDINITVININDEKPIFTSSATEIVKENQTKAITLEATDKDNKKLTYSISGKDAASFSISPTGVVTFKKEPVYTTKKEYKFTAIASDGIHKTTQEVMVTIRDPKVNNKKPIITSSATVEVEENQKSAIDVKATDADGHTLTYSISGTDVDSFTIDEVTGVVTFNEAPDYETKDEYTFTVKVSDGIEEVEQAITITIKNVIDTAPKITSSDKAIVPEGHQTTAMTVKATDADKGDVLTYSISGTDAGSLSIDASTGEVTFNTAPDYETQKEYKLTVKVSDTGGLSVTQDITITITNVNEGAPTITSPNTAKVKENQKHAITVTATDPDGDELTYEINNKEDFTISQTGVVTFKTAPNFESGRTSYNFTVTVREENDKTQKATMSITIEILDDENDNDTTKPVISIIGANPIGLTVGQDYTDRGATAKDDVDGYVDVTTTSNTVDTSTVGEYTVTYTATDAAGNEETATRMVKVSEADDTTPPVITLKGKESIELTVGDNYEDAGATATDNVDGNISAKIVKVSTVNMAKAGNYTVTYNVSDKAENKATQVTREVIVKAKVVVDTIAPTITLLGNSEVNLTVGDSYEDAGVTATDNVDGDISAKIVSNATTAVNTNKVGTYTVTYNVSDAAGNKAAQVTRTVTVKKKLIEDTVAPTITLLGNNEVNLTVGDVYADAGATAKDDKDGDITAKIVSNATAAVNTNKVGTYTATYNVSDAAGNKAPQVTRTVTVKAKVVVPPKDTTAPVITLKGTNPMTITVGEAYTEKGATATDNVDENLSAKIVINSSTVDTTAEGNYTVTYDVKDTAGNDAQQVIRKVNVTN